MKKKYYLFRKNQGIQEYKNDNSISFRDEQTKEVDKNHSIIYDDKRTETINDMTEKVKY